jgi:hypothetical protein
LGKQLCASLFILQYVDGVFVLPGTPSPTWLGGIAVNGDGAGVSQSVVLTAASKTHVRTSMMTFSHLVQQQ